MKIFLACAGHGVPLVRNENDFKLYLDDLLIPQMDQKTEYDPKTDEITIKSYNEPVNGFLIATCDIEAVIPLGAIRYNGEGYHDTECLSYEIPGKKYERYEGLGMHVLEGGATNVMPDSYELAKKLGMDTAMVMRFINHGVCHFGVIDRYFYAIVTKDIHIFSERFSPRLIFGDVKKGGPCYQAKGREDWTQGRNRPPLILKDEPATVFTLQPYWLRKLLMGETTAFMAKSITSYVKSLISKD